MINQTLARIPFVDLGAQYAAIRPEIDAAVLGSIARGDFILGEDVRRLEEEFAAYSGARHGIGVSNGTEALRLALQVCGVGPGDEVITAANTYIATVEAILQIGATPVLIDVLPTTYNMDAATLEAVITPRSKVIIPVHLYGQPADMDPILEIARRRGLKVIEDACQAHGATYRGRRAGSMGDLACFSFYPSKNLGAYGDGGMIVTSRDEFADSLGVIRNHGQREKYHHLTLGWNSRLDTVQASVLRVKLRYLDGWNAARRRAADTYGTLLSQIGIQPPALDPSCEHVYHLYVIEVDRRDALQAFLKERGIETGIHYPVPAHVQKVFRDASGSQPRCPVTERMAPRIVSLPFYAEITDEQIAAVVGAIGEFLKHD